MCLRVSSRELKAGCPHPARTVTAYFLGEVVLPELEPEVSELLLELPEVPLLLPVLKSEPLDPLLLPPGVKEPPVAELLPDRPKYENTLCRQLGWLRSVLESNVGAESNLLVSPANVKLGCCELEELLLLVAEDELPEEEARRSIHGTATCFPLADALDALLEELLELGDVLELLELGDVLELGLELLDEPPLREITANSNRPEFGLTMKSLIVPIWVPDEPVTWAPVS